ncbi:hypothetical protein EYF80_030459 [Liparis tanakae]|uniref:Uncharacterized protein n=1 Tax=Liparis tanakae TaxID=230148 RepID=A0A4Z2H0S8_9TELE|nr:hypothetical protein EYF80_030459 [Liparis tanakae]
MHGWQSECTRSQCSLKGSSRCVRGSTRYCTNSGKETSSPFSSAPGSGSARFRRTILALEGLPHEHELQVAAQPAVDLGHRELRQRAQVTRHVRLVGRDVQGVDVAAVAVDEAVFVVHDQVFEVLGRQHLALPRVAQTRLLQQLPATLEGPLSRQLALTSGTSRPFSDIHRNVQHNDRAQPIYMASTISPNFLLAHVRYTVRVSALALQSPLHRLTPEQHKAAESVYLVSGREPCVTHDIINKRQ